MLEGIKFVTDADGKKIAVQLDLKTHGELWDDIQDGLIAESRRGEQGIPWEEVKAGLVKSGKLKK
jgi:hypothetical protein